VRLCLNRAITAIDEEQEDGMHDQRGDVQSHSVDRQKNGVTGVEEQADEDRRTLALPREDADEDKNACDQSIHGKNRTNRRTLR